MLSLYKRGRIFWARGSVRGQRIRRSLDTTDRQIAIERRRDLERELWSGKRLRPLAWSDFSKEFLQTAAPRIKPSTAAKYEFVTNRFGKFLEKAGVAGLQGIHSGTIAAYQCARIQDVHPTRRIPVGREGLKSDLRILHGIFAYAVRSGYLESNPIRYEGLNSRARNTQPFSRQEIDRMLASSHDRARPDLRVIILTFLATGLRISDVCGLLKSDLDFASGQVIRHTQKRSKVVSIPMHPNLRLAIESHLKGATPLQAASPYVFPTSTGRKTLPETLDAILRRLWKRCGIEGAHAHRFRDTFAVNLLDKGATLYDVAKLLGITVQVCEVHYAPYTKELQARGQRLVSLLQFGV